MRPLTLLPLLCLATSAFAGDRVFLELEVDEASGNRVEIALPLAWLEEGDVEFDGAGELDLQAARAAGQDLKVGDREMVAEIRQKKGETVMLWVSKRAEKSETPAVELFLEVDEPGEADDVNMRIPLRFLGMVSHFLPEMDHSDELDLGAVLGKLGDNGPFVFLQTSGPDGTVRMGTR